MHIDNISRFIKASDVCDEGKQALALVEKGVRALADEDDEAALDYFRQAFSLSENREQAQKHKYLAFLSDRQMRSAAHEAPRA